MSASYITELGEDLDAWMQVEFITSKREVLDYSVVLLVLEGGQMEVVRLYDGAHGINELHRYGRRTGKQGETFHDGALGEGTRTAIEQIKTGCRAMIEGWRSQ